MSFAVNFLRLLLGEKVIPSMESFGKRINVELLVEFDRFSDRFMQ